MGKNRNKVEEQVSWAFYNALFKHFFPSMMYGCNGVLDAYSNPLLNHKNIVCFLREYIIYGMHHLGLALIFWLKFNPELDQFSY
jgi:hypothetical protein